MTNMSNNGVNYEDVPLKEFELSYTELNSMINQLGEDGKLQLEKDKEAVRNYFLENVNPNTMFFHDIEEKLNFLVRNDYYDKTLLDKYTPAFIKALFKQAYSHKFRFPTYFGALKFYTQYALKTFDGKRYLERFEDRVVMNALYLADGNEELASDILEEIISGRYQPATPTFLNAGKQQRGEMVSCFPAGTKIMTDKGLVNIEELNIDDKVLSHKGVFNKIEKVITNPNNEYLVAIKHYGHKDELISTPNHPVLVYTQRDVESLIDTDGADVENGFVWLEAQDVQEGDYVVFASLDEEHEQITYDLLSNFSDKEKMVDNNDFYKIVNGKFVYQVNNVRITNEKPDTVYNLEVEDSHTYTVNSAIVHNCFLGRTEDNMESISKTITNALQLSKRGGGVAFSLTNVREAGAPIKHIENASSGIIPVMKILEDSFSYANQLGARQGAGAVYLNVHHPDILHFLDTKRENADEKIRIKTLSLGVVIPDITFKLAQKNEDMYLFSPYDVQREYGKAFSDISVSDEYYNMLDNPRIRKTKINARKLFQTIAEIQFESGYPYILFEDTANKSNPIQGRINMSNLCVTGDTNIQTSNGIFTAEELYINGGLKNMGDKVSKNALTIVQDNRAKNQSLELDGVSLSDATEVVKTRENSEVYKVTTNEGYSIKGTIDHKLAVERNGDFIYVSIGNLVEGDKLLVQSGKSSDLINGNKNKELALIAGSIASDGTFVAQRNNYAPRIDLYGEKEEFSEELESAIAKVLSELKDSEVHHSSTKSPKFITKELSDGRTVKSLVSATLGKVLNNYNYSKDNKLSVPTFVWYGDAETKWAFIDGLFRFDGSLIVNNQTKISSIQLNSISNKFLQEVQELLLSLGIYSKIYKGRKAGTIMLPDSNRELKEYNTKSLYSLRIESIRNVRTMCENIRWKNSLQEKIELLNKFGKGKKIRNTATVSSVSYYGIEDVYDLTVPDGHSFIANGIVSSNCSEILQVNEPSTYKEDGSYDKIGKDISCNLGSLNIAQTFDSPDFEKTIEVAIRSLTSVSDLANISSVPSIEAGNKRSHAIGLGQMNLHGFLAREYIHYDSPEALDFANLYFYSVLYYALKASNKIAIERGETFDGFENSKYFTGEFFEQYIEKEETAELESTKKLLEKTSMKVPTIEDWKELAESIKTHGIYNQNLQAIPPTGSISYINNSTASIHPVTYNIEGRKEGKTGKAYYPQPYLSDETLPYYKNAYDIENSAIIDMYAVATKYVDQGSSLTLFYKPEIHTTRELNKMYIYAWRKGIKTLYYARVKPPVINGTEVETAEDYCVSCQL